ncbi:MAG: NAD-dependent epimerase/dehydratase family protein [Proteobacteria bacterium]|nr:NAD-dependent epimerase/dehydratase family protein [Pseudomonadota bacterium]NOG59100.1 NAD-dependent epimerase/dehydratase family protein [Pseudomonadota bacterium]
MLDYWKGKNVFITGINGFIGGNLAKTLLDRGANIAGLIRNRDRKTLLFYEGLADRVTLIQGELVDRQLLESIIAEQQIDAVFHFAAQVEVGVGIKNPYLTFETNIRGTYCLMEAIRTSGQKVQSIVVASTDKSYGSYPKELMPYKEDYPLKPEYPYDISKACADMIAQSYASDIFKLPVVVTRFCNIYGPGQLNFSAVIPDGIRSALGYTKFIPRGDGSQIRDFIYVEDVSDLYMSIGKLLGSKPEKISGEIFNAGTNTPHSVREVLEMIFSKIGNTKELEEVIALMQGKQTSGEIEAQYMDYEKVNKYTGWKPRHSLEQGMEKTIEWYEKYLKVKNEL